MPAPAVTTGTTAPGASGRSGARPIMAARCGSASVAGAGKKRPAGRPRPKARSRRRRRPRPASRPRSGSRLSRPRPRRPSSARPPALTSRTATTWPAGPGPARRPAGRSAPSRRSPTRSGGSGASARSSSSATSTTRRRSRCLVGRPPPGGRPDRGGGDARGPVRVRRAAGERQDDPLPDGRAVGDLQRAAPVRVRRRGQRGQGRGHAGRAQDLHAVPAAVRGRLPGDRLPGGPARRDRPAGRRADERRRADPDPSGRRTGVVLPTVAPPANWPRHWPLRADGMVPTSGAVVSASGLTGEGIRGSLLTLTTGEMVRPDLVLLDDPQTHESAHSQTQNVTREQLVGADVLGMAGPGQDDRRGHAVHGHRPGRLRRPRPRPVQAPALAGRAEPDAAVDADRPARVGPVLRGVRPLRPARAAGLRRGERPLPRPPGRAGGRGERRAGRSGSCRAR
jgi:hypothetical protein